MASLNKIMLIGNVGTEPEMRFTPNGNPVTSFRMATNWIVPGQEGDRKQETEWFSIVTWDKLAENCNQFLTKGQRVYAEGRLRTRVWDGQDGQRRTTVEVVARQVLFLDKQSTASLPAEAPGGELEVEDLPF